MKFKTDIEVVTGFIGSGKTSFINALVKNTLFKIEKALILQCEQGSSKISEDIINNKNITIVNYDPQKPLDEIYIRQIILEYQPHRMIIEYNGTRSLLDLLNILNKKDIRKVCQVTSNFFIADCYSYKMFLNNMPSLILPSLYHCNLIVFNNSDKILKEEFKSINTHINSLNKDTFILSTKGINSLEEDLRDEDFLDRGILKLSRILFKIVLSKIK